MTDTIVEAIRTGALHSGNVSFDYVKNVAGRDLGRWDELGRGRAILTSEELLDQYLYSYGPMTKSQWSQFLVGVAIAPGKVRVIDYGCGQGLAFALLFDHFGPSLSQRVEEAVLIEPSAIALARAMAVFACYCRSATVTGINKKLDDVTSEDLRTSSQLSTIHLFSNVLDIDDFDCVSLFRRMLKTKGRHSVLAVSHDRDFNGGSARFRDINRLVIYPQGRDSFDVVRSDISQFSCSNGKSAISWQLHLEVLHGPF